MDQQTNRFFHQQCEIYAIFKKEFKSYFNLPIAYIFITVFLVLSGWLFNARACLQASLPAFIRNTAFWRYVIYILIVVTVLIALWTWFGFRLWAALTGAGMRVFWSTGFTGHLSGFIAGILITTVFNFCSKPWQSNR